MITVLPQVKTIGEQIADIASSYIGQTEIPGNKGFTNQSFQKKMEAVGWKITYAWCAFFVELVWKEAYGSKHSLFATMDKLFSPSALSTYYNFAGHETWPTSKVPVVGAIAVFKHGVNPSRWEGHCSIVSAYEHPSKAFVSIEGNTNDKGGREGYIVSEKIRGLKKPPTASGLNLIGFIHPV